MPGYVIILDALALLLAVTGFHMAFRQTFVRQLIGRPQRRSAARADVDVAGDPLTYVLRIAGVMLMAFGIAIALMFTLVNLF